MHENLEGFLKIRWIIWQTDSIFRFPLCFILSIFISCKGENFFELDGTILSGWGVFPLPCQGMRSPQKLAILLKTESKNQRNGIFENFHKLWVKIWLSDANLTLKPGSYFELQLQPQTATANCNCNLLFSKQLKIC